MAPALAWIPSTESPPMFAQWVHAHLPEAFTEVGFLLPHWQWGGLLILAFLGVAVDRLTCLMAQRTLRTLLKRGHLKLDKKVAADSLRPLGILAMALVWFLGVSLLGIQDQVHRVLDFAIRFVAATGGVWAVYRGIDIVSAIVQQRVEKTATKVDDLLVPLIRKTLKVFVFAFGLVFVASNLGTNISSLLTGLGLGGLAFALAAQDTVKNLFGAVTILLDRPFQIGDWVATGDVEGTVEDVGFRSTKVRTFYNSLLVVPNSGLLNANIDNLGVRRYRRFKTMLSLTYDTPPEKLEAFCEGVRELILQHPHTRKDYFHVTVNQFSAASIDVLLYVFHETPDWTAELRERQRLMLDILRLARRLGVSFAFPTQTIQLARPAPASPETPVADAAEVERLIQQARQEGQEIVTRTSPVA